MNDLPTIRVDMDGISYHVRQAFMDRMDELKDYANKTIDAAFNQLARGGLETAIINAVQQTMREAIDDSIKSAVRDSVDEYFQTGAGQEFILKAIQAALRE